MNPKQLLEDFEIVPKKSLGQNFMHDPNALDMIVRTAEISPDDVVLEIGPGTGELTERLAEQAKQVFAVEIDERLRPILEERFEDSKNVFLVFDDILRTRIENLVGVQEYVVVANVPYYITSAIIRLLLEQTRPPKRIVISMQYEVAQRIISKPGDMTLLSVSVQFYGKPTIVSRLKPAVFYPRPEIDSAVLRVDVYPEPIIDVPNAKAFFKIVKAGFSMKRKQLKNSLAGGLGVKTRVVAETAESSGIDLRRRAETLTLEEWGQLTYALLPLC